jgi:hypothetical protein
VCRRPWEQCIMLIENVGSDNRTDDLPCVLRSCYAENPPSDLSNCPLIQEPSTDSRNDTKLAVSSGVPSFPEGCRWRSSSLVSSVIHPVSIGPGLMRLARTFRCASSLAAASTILSRAALLAPYGRFSTVGSLVRAMMLPPVSGTCKANCWISFHEARTLTAKCRFETFFGGIQNAGLNRLSM